MAQHEAAKKHAKSKDAPAVSLDDLASPEIQEAILNPAGLEASLFGESVTIHPLPARWALRFAGFSAKIFGSASVGQGENVVMRVGSVLAENHLDDFLPYVARALQKVDDNVPPAQIDKLVAEMNGKLSASSFLPLAGIFLAMMTQNKTMESLGLGNPQAKN